jgi:hypothetical protein
LFPPFRFDLVGAHAHTLISLLQVLDAEDVRAPLLNQAHSLARIRSGKATLIR